MPERATSDRPRSPRATPRRDVAPDALPQLQLSVSRFGLGMELSEPFRVGAMRIDALSAPLLGLSFPVDLSGGVPRFRHRRGTLERLGVTLLREPLVGELATLLSMEGRRPHVQLLPAAHGLTVGVGERDRAVAFELVWAPRGRDLDLIVTEARAVGHPGPAHLAALVACDNALGKLARREGSRFVVEDAPGLVLRAVLPQAGARVPSTDDTALSGLETTHDGLAFRAELGGPLPALHGAAARAIELAALTRDADDAMVRGDLSGAREGILVALERAPGHPDLAARLADLDRALGRRGETALATLTTAGLAVDAGPLGAALLADVGDTASAIDAYERAAEREPFSVLAALCLAEAAKLAEDARTRERLLGEAHARSPSTEGVVWTLFDVAVERGDVARARRLVDELAARTKGPAEKQRVLVRLAEKLVSARLLKEGKELLETALRFQPADPETLVMLGRALFELREPARAADVLSRALAAAEKKKADTSAAELLLARVLAEGLGDTPLAIARLRRLSRTSALWAEARHREASLLVELGDHPAASVVWDAMRTALEAQGAAADPASWAWLVEAARFELDVRGDAARAKLHASLALADRPRDAAVRELFRRAAREPKREETDRPPPVASEPPEADDAAVDERIESLTNALRAAPGDLSVAVELATLLDRTTRDLELFALTSARLEDGDDTTRRALLPFHRAALSRLADAARHEGREADAGLYETLARSLDG